MDWTIFWTIFLTILWTNFFLDHFIGGGGSTPLVLREGWDAVYQYRGRGGRKDRKFKISRLQS